MTLLCVVAVFMVISSHVQIVRQRILQIGVFLKTSTPSKEEVSAVLGHMKGVVGGGGGLTSNFFCWSGMDIFWNEPKNIMGRFS
jgi:hypothetical protein